MAVIFKSMFASEPGHSEKWLTVQSWSKDDGASLILYDGQADVHQIFEVIPVASGYFYIRNVNSNKVLDVKEGSKDNGAAVIQWSYHGGPNQLWRTVKVPSGFVLENKLSGKALSCQWDGKNDGFCYQWDWNEHDSAVAFWQAWCVDPLYKLAHEGWQQQLLRALSHPPKWGYPGVEGPSLDIDDSTMTNCVEMGLLY